MRSHGSALLEEKQNLMKNQKNISSTDLVSAGVKKTRVHLAFEVNHFGTGKLEPVEVEIDLTS
jgi:hypothetical protein